MTILDEANELTGGDRQDAYGHPLDNYSALADVWNALLVRMNVIPESGLLLTAEQTQVLLAAMKLVRLARDPQHRDSIVDLAGYARTIEMTIERRKKNDHADNSGFVYDNGIRQP